MNTSPSTTEHTEARFKNTHCWRSKNEFRSIVLLWTPIHGPTVSVHKQNLTFPSSVRTLDAT